MLVLYGLCMISLVGFIYNAISTVNITTSSRVPPYIMQPQIFIFLFSVYRPSFLILEIEGISREKGEVAPIFKKIKKYIIL